MNANLKFTAYGKMLGGSARYIIGGIACLIQVWVFGKIVAPRGASPLAPL